MSFGLDDLSSSVTSRTMAIGDNMLEAATIAIANSTSTVESDRWVVIGDVVVLTLTIFGAFCILGTMIYYEFKGRASTTRMRIVQSLVVSDLVMGIVGLIGSAMTLAGHSLHDDSTSCDGLGVMLVAVIFTQHLWTLSLAFATFMILIYPLHSLTSLLEKRWYWLWLLVWAISFGVAVLGYELYGYQPTGGICYYGTNAGLFAELIQFIPRGVVFVCIAFLYGRLFVFLRRPDTIRTGYSDSPVGTSGSYPHHQSGSRGSGARRITKLFHRGTRTVVIDETKGAKSEKQDVAATTMALAAHEERQERRRSSNKLASSREVPPWERVELPAFQVDGQRYGGTAANVRESGSMWGDWRGFATGRKRPSTTSSSSSATRIGSGSSGTEFPGFKSEKPYPISPYHDKNEKLPSALPVPGSPIVSAHLPIVVENEDLAPLNEERKSAEHGTSISSEPRNTVLSGGGAPSVSTASTPDAEAPLFFDSEIRRASAMTAGTGTTFAASQEDPTLAPYRRPSFVPFTKSIPSRTGTPAVSHHGSIAGDDAEKGYAQGGPLPSSTDEEDWDLMRMLRDAPPNASNDPFAVTSLSDRVEYVPESMASYLNRKTALLMLWFPLGYILLFSVSAIRIIYDFSGNPPASLRAISRWMIFSQGLLDALIYGIVEWHTKRVVRKRVRKGTFSPRQSAGNSGSGFGSAIRGLGSGSGARRSTPNNAGNTNVGVTSQGTAGNPNFGLSSVGQTQSVSFIDPDVSIFQRLDEGSGNGSGTNGRQGPSDEEKNRSG